MVNLQKIVLNFQGKVLRKAANKFVRYEVLNTTGFECEGGVYDWSDVTWILIDGSTYTYSVGTECD